MKTWIASFVLVLAATPAFAQNQFSSYDDYQVTILSWCEGNNVMAEDSSGNPYVVRNCDEKGQVCRVYDSYRRWGVTYAAICEAPQN